MVFKFLWESVNHCKTGCAADGFSSVIRLLWEALSDWMYRQWFSPFNEKGGNHFVAGCAACGFTNPSDGRNHFMTVGLVVRLLGIGTVVAFVKFGGQLSLVGRQCGFLQWVTDLCGNGSWTLCLSS